MKHLHVYVNNFNQFCVMKKLFLFFLIVITGKICFADDNLKWEINNVPINAISNNVTEAKEIAISEGQKQALKSLLLKLGVHIDQEKFDGLKVESLVQDISITNEKIGKNYYKATLGVKYDQQKMESLIRDLGILGSKVNSLESSANQVQNQSSDNSNNDNNVSILILPLVKKDDGHVLFVSSSPWLEAWQNYLNKDPNQKTVSLPEGDLEDIEFFQSDKLVKDYNKSDLNNLFDKYQVDKIILAQLGDGKMTNLITKSIDKNGGEDYFTK